MQDNTTNPPNYDAIQEQMQNALQEDIARCDKMSALAYEIFPAKSELVSVVIRAIAIVRTHLELQHKQNELDYQNYQRWGKP